MLRRNLIPLACGVAALLTAGAGVIASLHWQSWNTTSLVRSNSSFSDS